MSEDATAGAGARPYWAPRIKTSSIRFRLGLALALALLPVLVLGGVESGLTYRRDALDRQTALEAASLRSAATARTRLESAEILLQTLAPGAMGVQCAARLAEVSRRIPGYVNLIRFDSLGRVACAAADTPADALRRDRPWFQALKEGRRTVMVADAGAVYSAEPSLLAAVPAAAPGGEFEGALAAVITLESLRPEVRDRSLPEGSEVALADRSGRYLTSTRPDAFPAEVARRLQALSDRASVIWSAPDIAGERRIYSAARLVGDDVFVVLSAPDRGVFSFAMLNPLSTLVLPLLAFMTTLVAVWWVAERGVVRWIHYLQRIAGIYAKGRFTVHPVQAGAAPQEFRDLAEALDAMAATIEARDTDLKDSLAQKDALMREIHHRVKNNLQIITSLINLQQRALADPAARAAMSDTRQRISALALMYRSLYQNSDLRRVDLRDFLEELIAQIITGEPSGPQARTILHADSLTVDADRLAPLSLFAVEAITNARKHGLSGPSATLEVCFRVENGEASLSIADTGEGLTDSTGSAMGEGVGRTLMSAHARQLRGAVAYETNAKGGLTVTLTFPILDTEAASLAPAGDAPGRNSAAAQTF